MSVTTLSAGTIVNNSAVGDVAWSNPSNAGASDDSYAACVLSDGEASNLLVATNFGAAIPTNATITEVKMLIEFSEATGAVKNKECYPIINGAGGWAYTIEDTATLPTTDTVREYDGSNASVPGVLFGLGPLSITPEMVNDSTFGFVFTVENDSGGGPLTANVDHIKIEITYVILDGEHTIYEFKAGPSSVQSIDGDGSYKVTYLENAVLDINGIVDTVNDKVIPTEAGYYFFTGQISLSSLPSSKYAQSAIYKNGSIDAFGEYIQNVGAGTMGVCQSQIAGLITWMNGSTDYVELRARHNSGVGTGKDLSDSSAAQYITGYKL